jgi:DNA mismatch repair protein MutL
MDREDLALAFRQHATSKLAEADDLYRIRTLGFRGEALAAIAGVSKVRCQSRTADAEIGAEITIEGCGAAPVRECGCPPGTVIEVRNLFQSIPVRRAYLKADPTEAGHVAEMFTRIALAHPTVHLIYKSGSKVVYDLPATTGIKDRVAVFLGLELAESLLWVESRVESTHVWGYVAHPSQSRSNAKGQYLFVGGRYVRDRSLGHALSEAYRGLLMVGRQPVAFLYLEIPPEQVDVNVHPTKIEVRFRDSNRIYSQLLSTVRQTFLQSDLHTRLQAASADLGADAATPREPLKLSTAPAFKQASATWSTAPPSGGLFASSAPFTSSSSNGTFSARSAPLFTSGPPSGSLGVRPAPEWASSLPPVPAHSPPAEVFDEFAESANEAFDPTSASALPSSPPADPDAQRAPARAPGALESGRPLKALQVHDSYLIAETDEGMVVIDQHALHERILYEELRERVERGGVEAQRLLVPEPVDLDAADAAEILERQDVLGRLGLGVEPFGGDTVLVTSTPAMLAGVPPVRLLRDLADHFRSMPVAPTPDAILEDVLNMVACKAAIKAGQRLSPEEVSALLERRHLVANTHHCPHGRPTALTFTKSELERQFGRI